MMSLPFGRVGKTPARESFARWAALYFMLLSVTIATPAQKSEEHDKDDPRARAEYLEQKRGGKTGTPPGARLRALKEVDGMLEREGKAYWDSVSKASTSPTVESSGAVREATTAGNPSPISQSQWTPIGPQATNSNGGGSHFSGRVTALAVDPNDLSGKTVYLGAAQGGVWKTTDGGVNWTVLTDNQPSLAIGSIAIDPGTNPSTIYVGTGEENYGSDSYYGVGILKSVDGGSTWTGPFGQVHFSPATPFCTGDFLGCGGARIGAIAIQPGTSGATAHLMAAVNTPLGNSTGLYYSADGGINWGIASNAAAADSVVFVSSSVALVGLHGLGVYSCTGFPSTPSCVPSNTGITTTATSRVSMAANGSTVYAALEAKSTSALSGFYKSTDAGVNWTRIHFPLDAQGNEVDFCNDQCFYDMLVAVNPMDPLNVFVGGSGTPNPNFLYRSTNGGASWVLSTGNNIHADQHAASFSADGTKMYIGNDGGVYSTTNTTTGTVVVWTELNNTLNITQFYGYFSIHPTDSQVTFGGTQDNGTQKYGGLLAWDQVTCGDGASAVIDVNTPSTVYANCQFVDIRRSASGNAGTFGFNNPQGAVIDGADGNRVSFIPPMVGDSGNPMKLYFGTYRLWRATSAASLSWAAITGDLTGGGMETITNIGISPDSDTAFVVTTDGRVTRVAALNSSPSVGAPVVPPGIPASTQISSVAVVDFNNAYIAVPGFKDGFHVWRTTDGGVNWTNITNNLPNTPVNDLVVDPDIPGTLYLGTDVGVFISSNNGASWTTLMIGLPKVAVFGLKLHRASRTLRAATHGRGMWDLSVPACSVGPCASLSPAGLSFGNQPVGTSSAPQTITLTNLGTQTLTVTNISAGGEFSQTNNCTSVPVNGTCAITVTFYPRAGSVRRGGMTLVSNAGTPAHADFSGVGTVIQPNDDFANGATITSGSYTTSMNTLMATSQASDPIPPVVCVNAYFPADPLGFDGSSGFNHHAVWFNYTPATSGTVSIDTLTTDYDTVLSVWTGTPGNFNSVACNDDMSGTFSAPSQLTMSVTAGTTYRILVSGFYANDAGNMVLHLSGPTPVLSFSAAGLAFSGLPGHISGPQSLTLTNNTVGTIAISNVSVSGDYSLSQNCTASGVPAGGSCSVSVTFAPSSMGQRNGIITITDSASGSPQMVPIIGFAFDLGLGFVRLASNGIVGTGQSTSPGSRPTRPVRSAADIVVVAGQSRSLDLELTSSGNSNEVINLECVGAPPGASCTVEPAQVTLSGASIPIQVTFDTSKVGAATGSGRAKRLSANTRAATGSYELQVSARAGDVVKSTFFAIQVISNQPSKQRLPVQQSQK